MREDGIIGAAAATLGLLTLFVFIPTQISELSAAILATGVSPRVFPQLAAGGLTALGVVLIVQDVLRLRKERGASGEGREDTPKERLFSDVPAVLAFFGAILLYVIILPLLGHIVATPLAIVGFMYLLGERSPVRIAGAAVATTAFLSIFFRVLLNTVLPSGVFF